MFISDAFLKGLNFYCIFNKYKVSLTRGSIVGDESDLPDGGTLILGIVVLIRRLLTVFLELIS